MALAGIERDKINYLNGFVRGGLHQSARHAPAAGAASSVTYGAVEGPANTFTKDINEEGVFLFTDKPLPETSQVHMLVTVPGKSQPLSLVGKVSHTVVAAEDEPWDGHRVRSRRRATRGAAERDEGFEEALEKGALPNPTIE